MTIIKRLLCPQVFSVPFLAVFIVRMFVCCFFLLLLSIFALIFLVFVYKRSHTFSFVDLSQTFASFLLLSLSFSLSMCLSLDNRAPLKALSFS